MVKNAESALRSIDKVQPAIYNLTSLREQVDYYNTLSQDDKYYNLQKNTIEYKITLIYIGLVKGLRVQYLTNVEEGLSKEEALFKIKKDLDELKNLISVTSKGSQITEEVIFKLF